MNGLNNKKTVTAYFDLGHSVTRLGVLAADALTFATYEASTKGFAKGKVTDINDFSETITHLVKLSGLQDTPHRAIVNIPSLQTRSLHRTIIHRCGGTYRSSDFFSVKEAAGDAAASDLDEILDVHILNLSLDGHSVHPLAFGLSGRDIKAQAMIATHPKLVLADILSVMNSCGLEVSEFRSNAFGLARALKALRPESDQAVIMDIGHSTTTGVVVIGGIVQQIFSFAAGSHHMTKDMSIGLHSTIEYAEEIKLSQGLLESLGSDSYDLVDYKTFLRPRVQEILLLAAKNFSIYLRTLDSGLLFCGRGALLQGLSSFATGVWGVQTPPFTCQLDRSKAEIFLGAKISVEEGHMNSGWFAILGHVKAFIAEYEAIRAERDSRPLSKLRPLWTWISELSR